LGGDVESLILDVARQVLAKIAVAGADVEHRAAGAYLRQLHVLAKPHPLFAGIAPVVAFAVELGELGGRRGDSIGHGSENYHGSKPLESLSFGQPPCASSTWLRRSRAPRMTLSSSGWCSWLDGSGPPAATWKCTLRGLRASESRAG